MITVVKVEFNADLESITLPDTAIFDDDFVRWYYYQGIAPPCSIAPGVSIVDQYPPPPKGQRMARVPAWMRGSTQDPTKTILIPGEHVEGSGRHVEQSTSQFAETVVRTLPPDALYRWDRIVGEVVGEQFRAVTADRMRLVVDRYCRLAGWRGKPPKTRMTYQSCTKDLAGLVEAAAVSGPIRELRMIVTHPVYGRAADGTITRAMPGWNPETGILYIEPEDLRGVEPCDPDLMMLIDLMVDFPFRDMASRMNLIGLMLTVLLRPCFPTVPIHLVQSSIERTGKGMLISSIIGSLIGRHVPSVQVGEREEEREKRFTTLILEGATAIHLDNIPGSSVLDSPSLCALATTPVWKGRVLGSSSMPTLPNTLTLIASANNLRATAEVAKRIVPIWLEPHTSRPESRTDFVHPDIHDYARRARRVLVATLLGMTEAWIARGAPKGSVRLGGFESWASTIGGIMESAGADGWLANRDEWASGADEWGEHVQSLVEGWAETLPEVASAAHLLALAERLDLFPDIMARPAGKGRETAFGMKVMRRLIDRPVCGYKIRKADMRGAHYVLIPEQSQPNLNF